MAVTMAASLEFDWVVAMAVKKDVMTVAMMVWMLADLMVA